MCTTKIHVREECIRLAAHSCTRQPPPPLYSSSLQRGRAHILAGWLSRPAGRPGGREEGLHSNSWHFPNFCRTASCACRPIRACCAVQTTPSSKPRAVARRKVLRMGSIVDIIPNGLRQAARRSPIRTGAIRTLG